MEQYISKSALLAEIERLVNNYDKALDYEAALEDVRYFIDNYESKEVDSQVNPQVKESAETQHVNDMCKENGNSLTQEPVSEDLMDATNNYCVNARKGYPRVMDETDRYICNAFKAGAKWQETKDKQILNEEGVVILPEEEFERMKRSLIKLSEREQQMMAKAIDGVVTFDYYEGDKAYGCVAHDSFCYEDWGLKDRDEVKILILKK